MDGFRPSPEPPQRHLTVLDRARIETYIGVVLAIVLVVFPMTWLIRSLLLLGLCGIVCDLWLRHPLTVHFPLAKKIGFSFVTVLAIGALSWYPLKHAYIAEHTPPQHIPTADEIAADVAKTLDKPGTIRITRLTLNPSLSVNDRQHFPAGKQPVANLYFKVVGSAPVVFRMQTGALFIRPLPCDWNQNRRNYDDQFWDNLISGLKYNNSPIEAPPEQERFNTWFTNPLTKEQKTALSEGNAVLYLGAVFAYKDVSRVPETDLCAFLLNDMPSIHLCYRHNGP